jgi:saccharopine dehydrogenase (NAD+, L-lysine-forming)
MKKVLIVGAGAQGGPCASVLARDKDVSEIVLGDIDLDFANKVKAKIKSDKITATRVDAGKVEDIVKAARGADAIINLTLTAFNENIMQAALKSGAHYVDTSFGEPSLMDICARDNILAQIIEKRPLAFDSEFKEAGLTALVGCGSSPGMVNVLARYGCDKLDRVDEIRIRIGRRLLTDTGEVVKAWTPTWSPFRALWGYAVEPTVFEDGEYKKYPIYSKCENYTFPEPVGTIPLVYHQHQEPITLPYFIGKGIKYCDFKYTVDKEVGTLIKNGFASSEPIDVRGIKVAPRDVLLNLVPRPVDTFFTEDETTARAPLKVTGFVVIEITGAKSREKLEYKMSYPIARFATPEERLELYKRFGATNIYVCIPAIVGAKMCMEGLAEKGLISSECLDPIKFLKIMAEMGVPMKLHETLSKEKFIP